MLTKEDSIPIIEVVTGDNVDKTAAKGGYTPPSSEPVRDRIDLPWHGKTEVWITGHSSDLIDIISNRALIWRDYVREDSHFNPSDIRGNDILVTARGGRLNDLLTLYGLVYSGKSMAQEVDVVRFYIRDGKDISAEVVGNEVFVTYGNQKDLRTRFTYEENRGWYRSAGNNRGHNHFPPATEKCDQKRMPT